MQFKIYRSSAGSGKTFTLAKEYLKLALLAPAEGGEFMPSYYKKILAVTFTNDAANEMKERIMGYLAGFATEQHYDEGMKKALIQEITTDYPQLSFTEEEFFRRAKAIHEHLLHNYSDFSVSTIDSFNHRIVQSFKKDLQLPYSFDIELDTTELREEVSARLQSQVEDGKDHALNHLMVEFALNKADEGKSWFISKDFEDFAHNLFDEERHAMIEQLGKLSPKDFKEAKNKVFNYLKEVEESVQQKAQQAVALVKQHQIEHKSFYYGNKGIGKYFEKLAAGKEPFYKVIPNSYVWKAIEENKWTAGKADATQKTAIEFISGDLAGFFEAIEDIKEKELSNYIIAHSLKKNIYLLATITELSRHLEVLKEEKSVVHISEFNRKINVIVEEEPVPYIYERMGERYMHILIDEFQDTSEMQWHNLIPLVANALGFDMQNMVVGDAKQAIYRWRGGKADMLVNLPDVPTAPQDSPIAEHAYAFHSQANPQVLGANYRSKPNVINFNNHFFESCRDTLSDTYPGLANYYAEVSQKPHKPEGGHIQLEFIEDARKKENYQAATYVRVQELIEDAQTQGFELKDIAILTRNRAEGIFLAEQLLAANIPIISAESLLVANSPFAKFIVNFLRLLHQPFNPLDKINLAFFLQNHFNGLLLSGFSGLGDGKERFDIQGENLERLKAVAENPDLKEYNQFLKEHFQLAIEFDELKLMTLYEKVETFIRLFHLQEVPAQQAYLHKLLDFVMLFSLRSGNDLGQFLEYWERKARSLSVSTPKSSNAVQIMTIHKSKGLQFPIVILPFADWEMTIKANSTLWHQWEGNPVVPELPTVILSLNKELASTEFADVFLREQQATFLDAFNMLYVAFTRPESQLYVIGKSGSIKSGIKHISHLLTFYLDSNEIASTDFLPIRYKLASGEAQENQSKVYVLHEDRLSTPSAKKADNEEIALYAIDRFIHANLADQIKTKRETSSAIEAELTVSDLYKARLQGILVHYAFEKVRYIKDVPKAVSALVAEGKIESEEKEALEAKMNRVLSLPEIATYYQPQAGMRVENEKEILLGLEHGQLRTARPDRVVFLKDTVVIIDYKTGIEKVKEHQLQVRQYGYFFEKMDYKNIKLFLIYTEEERVVEV